MADNEVKPGVDEDINENEQLCTEEQPQVAEGTADDIPSSPKEPRRSQRVHKLTEKGQDLHDEQVRKAAHRFSLSYERWRDVTNKAKEATGGQCSKDVLQQHVIDVANAARNVKAAYVELRSIESRDNSIRRKMDTCEAVTKKIS